MLYSHIFSTKESVSIMPVFFSLLKTMRNFNQIHFERCDLVETERTKYGTTFRQLSMEIEVRPIKRYQHVCPICLKEDKCYKQYPGYDTKRTTYSKWRTLDCFGVPTYLIYRPQRIQCDKHGVVTEYIPWADGKSRFTSEFNDTVTFMTGRASIGTIAEFFDISWETVGECVRHTLERVEPDRRVRLEGLTHICIDETSMKKGYKFISIAYDMVRCRVFWIGTGVGDEVYKKLIDYIPEEQRNKIVLIAGDGAKWIDRGMCYFPNATRAVDPFHVVGWVQEALDMVRKSITSKANSELRKCQEQCKREIQAANEAALKLKFEISHVYEELAKLPTRGRVSKRKKELKAYLAELLAQQQEMEAKKTTRQEDEPSDPLPVLTEEERKAYQEEYDAMPRKGRKSARKQALERILGIVPKAKKAKGQSELTPEQQATIKELQQKACTIKGARFALYHNPENRTDNQTDKLKWIEASCPDLYQAYQLKEQLRTTIHMDDPVTAGKALDLWIESAENCGLKPMVALSKKILRHRQNILNSIEFHANSARSESCNTTVKALITMGRGFRNTDNLISLIYFRCSDLDVPLFNRPYKSPEYKAEQRARARVNRKAREAKNTSA